MDFDTYLCISLPEAFAMMLFLRALLGRRDSFGVRRIILASIVSGTGLFAIYSVMEISILSVLLQGLVLFAAAAAVLRLRPLEAFVGVTITWLFVTLLQGLSVSVILPITGRDFSNIGESFPLRLTVGYTEIMLMLFCTFLLNLWAERFVQLRRRVAEWFRDGKHLFVVLLLLFTLLIGIMNYLLILENYDVLIRSRYDVALVILNFSVILAFAVVAVTVFIGTVHEIERRKAAELALRENENKLLVTQRMESLGRVAGWIAHDFGNLLTPIFGNTALLLSEQRLDEDLRARVAEIQDLARKASALTKDLLSYSRREPGRYEILDLGELLENFYGMLVLLAGKDIRLTLNVEDEAYRVNADRSRIEQVLLNLVTNARDAMSGDGDITIDLRSIPSGSVPGFRDRQDAAKTFVLLSVSDTGCGMDEATLSRIFDPFFTGKESGKGTGLGLAIVQGIVSQHGGTVSVRSERGKGSSFAVYLPSTEVSVPAPASTATTSVPGSS